jgi:hypothetical protein
MTATLRQQVGAVLFAVLLVTSGAAMTAGLLTAGASAAPDGTAVDVVFVLDGSANGEPVGERFGDELENVTTALDERGVDARYGLVTYESGATVVTGLTPDAGPVGDDLAALSYEGSFENASTGVTTAAGMSFRPDAARLYVVLTSEDDSSPAAARDAANGALTADGATLFVAGPDVWQSRADTVGGARYDVPSAFEPGSVDLSGMAGPLADTAAALADSASDGPAPTAEPDIDVADVSVAPSSPVVGEPVAVSVTVENRGDDDGTVEPVLRSDRNMIARGEAGDRIEPGASRTYRFRHSFGDTGSYVLGLDHRYLETVRVTEPAASATNVTVLSENLLRADVRHAHPGRVVMADLPANGVADRTGVHIAGVGVQPPQYTNLSFEVVQQAPVGATADGVEPLSRFTVRDGGADLGTVTARFGVDRRVHTGLTGAQVFVQRLDATGAVQARIDPTLVNTTAGRYDFRFDDPDAGPRPTYRVVAGTPSWRVESWAVRPDPVRAGESAAVTATVRNVGTGGGLMAVPLWVDGRLAGVRLVHLDAGERRTVAFSTAFADDGRHRLAVGNTTERAVVAWPRGVAIPALGSTNATRTSAAATR